MRSKPLMLACLFLFPLFEAHAALPVDKRTILTSGEKVFVIRYQLGQSTVLFFGLRPETVICGNKNYFNIEKIKDGITVQPLSNFSTNLTVMADGRRYLFYLTPARSARPDGFVDVKWVPSDQARGVQSVARNAAETVRTVGQKMKISIDLELTVVSEKSFEHGRRRILELEMKNSGPKAVQTELIELVVFANRSNVERQVALWEDDDVKSNKSMRGRLIVSGAGDKDLTLVIGYRRKSFKLFIKGMRH